MWINRWKLLLLAGVVIGCAKPASNPYRDEIVSTNMWYPVAYGTEQLVYYYAPFQTTYAADGLITTMISQSKGHNSERNLPGRWEINCFDKTVKIHGIDSKGAWKLVKDWEQVGKKTVAEQAVANLCLKSAAGRDDLEFIAMGYDKKTGVYETYFWTPTQNLSEEKSSAKTYQIFNFKSPNGGWSHFYTTVDCTKRYFANSTEANSKDLKWNSAYPSSAAELITLNACGFPKPNLDVAKIRNQQNYVATTKGAQKAKVDNTAPMPHSLEPVIRTVQVTIESTPNGATVKDVKSGQNFGVTPFVVNHNLDVTKLKAGRCTEISALSFEWISGAKTKTSNPYKICMYADDRFLISMQRPKTPGIQVDIDYQVKLQQLKIQQEALAAQQRQAAAAEQQARAQEAQATAESKQAKSAQDALLLQMFQGGSMIKKSPTRLPIDCSPTVSGGYSCY